MCPLFLPRAFFTGCVDRNPTAGYPRQLFPSEPCTNRTFYAASFMLHTCKQTSGIFDVRQKFLSFFEYNQHTHSALVANTFILSFFYAGQDFSRSVPLPPRPPHAVILVESFFNCWLKTYFSALKSVNPFLLPNSFSRALHDGDV